LISIIITRPAPISVVKIYLNSVASLRKGKKTVIVLINSKGGFLITTILTSCIAWRCLPNKTSGKKQDTGKKKKCFL